MPNDRKRGDEINAILDKVLKIDESNFMELDADFKLKDDQERVLGMKYLTVKWREKNKK